MSRGRWGGRGRFVYEGSWAGRPAASAFPVGSWIRITSGFGATGRTAIFETDGTYWRPLNGRAMLASFAYPRTTPIASLVGTAAQQLFTLPSNILLPAGAIFPGARIWGSAVFQRTVSGGPSAINMQLSVGQTPNTLGSAVVINTGSLSNNANQVVHVIGFVACVSSTQFAVHNYLGYNGQTAAANSGESTACNPALDSYMRVHLGAEATAADTVSLLSLAAWLEA